MKMAETVGETRGFLRGYGFLRLAALVAILICGRFLPVAEAVELDTVYRLLGPYRVSTSPGLRLYYPISCQTTLNRVMSVLGRVRTRYNDLFPELKGFQVTVLLTDHDDRDASKSDSTFDLITLSLVEQTDALSTRGYSLEQRFSLRMAYTMVLRSLGSSHVALRRRLALLSIPPWFLEGLAMHYAFPMDALHSSRLLELARTNSLFTLDDLDTINDRSALIQEEMRFQARHMVDYWHEISSSSAGLKFLDLIRNRPVGFDQTFRDAFGFPLKEGLRKYKTRTVELAEQRAREHVNLCETLRGFRGSHYLQGVRPLSRGGYAWVSSARYREEVYDLWLGEPGKARLALKNVHPGLWVDPASDSVFLAKYELNDRRQRRLSLWEVPAKGCPRKLVDDPGSFKPLGLHNGRLLYLNTQSGWTRVMSVCRVHPLKRRVEFEFPISWRPLEVAWDETAEHLYFVLQECSQSRLCRLHLPSGIDSARVLLEQNGMIIRIQAHGELLVAREDQSACPQVFRFPASPEDGPLEQLTNLPGGVWDFTLASDSILATTVRHRGFLPVALPVEVVASAPGYRSSELKVASLSESTWHDYQPEFRSSYWLPKVSRDDQGAVGGIYSYRADRLDRQRIIFSPTYGFKSKDWGYLADYQRRWDLITGGLTLQERVVRKSYLANSYYERIHSTDLHFDYPFSLSTAVTVGGNMSHRGIAEAPEQPGTPVPTVGRDHSLYVTVKRRSIRTEPLWEVFPRRGREVEASYRKGVDMFDGELKYDSMSARWNEFVPLPGGFVGTLRLWFAEDDKEGGVRRPEDLSLGGSDYLRGYPGAVRFGDSLRYAGIHIGHTLNFRLPFLRRWVQKEIVVLEGFAERGDVRSEGRSFDYLTDTGLEVRAKGLLLRRLPVTVRFGQAWPRHGNGKSHSYWTVDFSTLTSLLK